MGGVCKLCEKNDNLKESHFIPKFVGKWIKQTSVTGYIREKNQLHKRAQDIAKEYWLCGACEQLFSGWEREFANKVFYPFVNEGKSVANYDNWMSKFCASLSWRTLTYIRSKNSKDENDQERKELLDAVQEHLRKYLLGETDNLNQYEQHLFPLEKIESTDSHELPPSINRYFLRIMGMDIVGNSMDHYIFTKLPSFMLLGVIKAKNVKLMRSSRIAIKSGILSPRDYRWPDGLASYIFEKADEITKLHRSIPQKHLDSFDKYIQENPEKVIKSKQFQAFLDDYERFGDDVFN
ncbi:MAG: hypothetical protein CMH22_10760 [Methylophaga sp.]|jgi:hypothetical protein|uniref:hypothetical protein n=1 Tax=Methylophaga sp. UBA678 TaxID=1946901 RepID=UPI000C4FEFD0|nr:hypothetical protein [Methylophaga sp. UBA678]MAX52450.1 hypothetical protein [Methylophaga sp.]|tara:strand:+ start:124548 stop:125426 length:879 start_codon:yes stop_codon:yes gene_type:complete